jgi:hypothetical protein
MRGAVRIGTPLWHTLPPHHHSWQSREAIIPWVSWAASWHLSGGCRGGLRAGDLSDPSPSPSPSPSPCPFPLPPLPPIFLSQGLHVSKKLLRFMVPPPRDNSWIGATLRASPGFCMCHRGAAARSASALARALLGVSLRQKCEPMCGSNTDARHSALESETRAVGLPARRATCNWSTAEPRHGLLAPLLCAGTTPTSSVSRSTMKHLHHAHCRSHRRTTQKLTRLWHCLASNDWPNHRC